MHQEPVTIDEESALLGLAQEVARDCYVLAKCLAALEAAPSEQLEECWLCSLEQVQLLRARISAGTDELGRRRTKGLRLSPGAQGALDGTTAEAARLLQQAASSYSRLTEKVSLLLNEVGQKVADVQRGGRVLRSYASAARPAK